MSPKYPDITVQLTGTDGNVFAIIGRVKRALPHEPGIQFMKDAMACDSYDAVLQLVLKTVNVT